MIRLIVALIIISQAYAIGYIIGHNDGFDTGEAIGGLDRLFCFQHNGKAE